MDSYQVNQWFTACSNAEVEHQTESEVTYLEFLGHGVEAEGSGIQSQAQLHSKVSVNQDA